MITVETLDRLKFHLFLLLLGFSLLLPHGSVDAQATREAAWQVLETRYTLIRYKAWEDLKKLNRKVDYSPGSWGLKGLFGLAGSDNLSDELPKKMDALYERVQGILDMRRRMTRVSINVYQNKTQLHAAFGEIFKSPCPVRAWYMYENNTIYLNAMDVHEGILAHEMAHSIIDHYLLVRPPKATAEILARYVDAHLFE